MNTIRIEGLISRGFHGVYDFERKEGRDFRYDVEIKTNLIKGNTSDNIEDTIDYAAISEIVLTQAGNPVNLIEHLAHKIATEILAYSKDINTVKIKITKLMPPINATICGVSVEMEMTQ